MISGTAIADLEAGLSRIDAQNDSLRTFITVTGDQARQDATAVDVAAAEGRWLGLLHGMTIAVKDNIDTAGVRTLLLRAGCAYQSATDWHEQRPG